MKLALVLYIFLAIAKIPAAKIPTAKISTSQSVSTKFHAPSHKSELNEALNFNRLGGNYNLVIDQIRKAHNDPEEFDMIEDHNEPDHISGQSVNLASTTDTFEIPSPMVRFRSYKNYFKDYFKFKQQTISQPTDLTVRIKNYDDLLSKNNDLTQFTDEIIQESLHDEDFHDYNFKQFGDHASERVNHINTNTAINNDNIQEFIDYLIKYEGFSDNELKFLRGYDLDYGLDEIEEELNKINYDHINHGEKTIDIGGEKSGASGNQLSLFLISFVLICQHL